MCSGESTNLSGQLETDHVKLSSLSPGRVTFGNDDVIVTQVACGLQHTVLLSADGKVYTFGSNHYGQLGHGDTVIRYVTPYGLLGNGHYYPTRYAHVHSVEQPLSAKYSSAQRTKFVLRVYLVL